MNKKERTFKEIWNGVNWKKFLRIIILFPVGLSLLLLTGIPMFYEEIFTIKFALEYLFITSILTLMGAIMVFPFCDTGWKEMYNNNFLSKFNNDEFVKQDGGEE